MYNADKVKPLHIMIPKASAYVKRYDGQNKWMHLLFENDYVLEENNPIWSAVI